MRMILWWWFTLLRNFFHNLWLHANIIQQTAIRRWWPKSRVNARDLYGWKPLQLTWKHSIEVVPAIWFFEKSVLLKHHCVVWKAHTLNTFGLVMPPWSSWLMARTTGCDFLGRIQVECILYQDCPSAPTPPTSMLHCPGQHGLAGRHWQALDSWTPPLKKSISLLSWSLFNHSHSDAGRHETNEDVTINSPVRVKIKEFRDNLWKESMNWFIEGGKGD